MRASIPPGITGPGHPDWPHIAKVERSLLRAFGGQAGLEQWLGESIRKAVDFVVDTAESGRKLISELEKTEKTYLGTRMEILVRRRLGVPRGRILDLLVDGEEVDVKFTLGGTWMIPREARGRMLLLLAADEVRSRCWMGLVVANPPYLRAGENQDLKTSLSAAGWAHIRWLVRNCAYEPAFWRSVPQHVINQVFDPTLAGGTARLDRLFELLPRKPIPRQVIADVTQQLDFTRRVRENGGARDLSGKRFVILSDKANDAVQNLGLPPLPKGAYMSVEPQDAKERAIIEQSALTRMQKEWKGRRATPRGRKKPPEDDDVMLEASPTARWSVT